MSRRSVARAALCAAALAIAGCATHGPVLQPVAGAGLSPAVEIDATPFYPQRDYQCGPAALATVLVASGAAVTPDELVPEVYLPERRGSLQPELVGAVRSRGRLPYVLPESEAALLATLAAGIPVLVLQKLGAGPWPGWHYAVVIGYDLPRDRVVLRSGTTRRHEMSAAHFLATWDRASRWALVVLEPGVLPPAPDLARYMEAAAGLEAVGRLDDAALASEAAAREWPAEALPQLALANIAFARGDVAAAERGFRTATRLDPANVAAHNNRAEVLHRMGCIALARREIEAARALAGTGPLAKAVEATSARLTGEAATDAPGCPAD
jgi:hypothetical protein